MNDTFSGLKRTGGAAGPTGSAAGSVAQLIAHVFVDHLLRPLRCVPDASARCPLPPADSRRDVVERRKRECAMEKRAGGRDKRKPGGRALTRSKSGRRAGAGGGVRSFVHGFPTHTPSPGPRALPDKPPSLDVPFARSSRSIAVCRAPRVSAYSALRRFSAPLGAAFCWDVDHYRDVGAHGEHT